MTHRWVDRTDRARRGHRRPGHPAALRHRHRVPPRADVLPPPRARPAGLAGRPRARRPAGRRPGAADPPVRQPGPGRRPRRPAGPRRADPRRRGDPGAPVRHPGGGRVRRLRHAVAVVAAAGRARHHAGQGRPADRLAAPPADRRPAVVRRRRRRVAARAARPPGRRAGRRSAGWAGPRRRARSCAPGRPGRPTPSTPGSS